MTTDNRTIRRALTLAVLLHWLGWAAAAWSQIVGPAEIEMGEPLILESQAVAPAGGLIKHLWSGDCKFIEADGGRLIYVWPPQPGVYDFGDMVATYAPSDKAGEVGTLTQTPYTHTVTVKAAAPAPEPQPQPVVETLRSMVDDATAAKLSSSFSAILPVASELVGKETCGGARRGVAAIVLSAGVAVDSKAGVELAKRFDAALGDDPAAPTTDKYPAAIRQAIADLGQPLPQPQPTPSNITAVVYVYEKDDTVPPPQVLAALDKLNRGGAIIATAIDDDVVDGDGDAPDQYVDALAEARKAGLPALVAMADRKTVRVIKSPATEAAVMEAVR